VVDGDDRGGMVLGSLWSIGRHSGWVGRVEQAEPGSQLLECTISGSLLLLAGRGMFREQEAGQLTALQCDGLRVGLDRHPFAALPDTAGREHAFADIDNADTADPGRFQAGVVAQRRDFDSRLAGGVPDRGSLGDSYRVPIDRQFDGGHGGGGGGGGGGFRSDRPMFTTTCAQCGQEAQVPFQPRGDRPVYCNSCFSQQRQSRSW